MIFYIYSYFAYLLFEYIFRKKLFHSSSKKVLLQQSKRISGKEHWLFVSPGYWFARYYKNKIVMHCSNAESEIRKFYLKSMNMWNLWLTVAISISYLILSHFQVEFAEVFSGFIAFRFMSRMFEVPYAFISDVLSDENKSKLTKYERIKLASSSYVELFFLSAPIYLMFDLVCNSAYALSASLSVGTLTNVGFLVSDGASIYSNVAFVQVFATMSLVIFSLAMYLSRDQ